MPKKYKFCYIFHVIGTLDMTHVQRAIESINQQEMFRWDTCIVYNASDLDTDLIISLLPKRRFGKIKSFPVVPGSKSVILDWSVQMAEIGDHDFYFCHKADWYLPINTIDRFQRHALLYPNTPWFISYSPINMKEWATVTHLREYARRTFDENTEYELSVPYGQDHTGKVAVWCSYESYVPDGTMHGYTDSIRKLWEATDDEKKEKWGVSHAISRLYKRQLIVASRDNFAIHMWHDTPDRTDSQKIKIGERF